MNFTSRIAFNSFLFCLVGLFSASSVLGMQSDPIMSIAGQAIDKSELIHIISKGKSDDASPGLSRDEFEENLEMFVNYKLKIKEAESQNLDKTEEFIREFESFKETLMAPYLIKNSLEEGELRKAYSRMQEIIRASHILFQFPPNASTEDSLIVLRMALKVQGEIKEGGNVDELAVKYSDDPSVNLNKGDLGYFTSLQMVAPFEDAVYNMQPGEISDPVLTDFGYHIIINKDRRPNPGQVKVSHLLVRLDPYDPNSDDVAKRKVADVYEEIQKESTVWNDIVKNYSEDQATNQKGGELPWFSVGSMIPEFEMVAFSLSEKGEVSPPVKTQYGYHILRLEDQRPLESYDALEKSIRSKILRASRASMIQSQVVAIQKSRYNFLEYEQNLALLKEILSGKESMEFKETLDQAEVSFSELFSIEDEAFDIDAFLDYVEEKERIPLKPDTDPFDLWYQSFVSNCLNEAEKSDLIANNSEYQMTLKEYRDGILLFSLMNKEVWQKGIMDSLGQRAFYVENIADYQWKERVEAFTVKVLDPEKADIAKNYLEGKKISASLQESFKEEIENESPLAFQSEYGLIEIEDNPVLSKLDPGQDYQEIESEGHLHLVLTGAKIPGGPKDFTETRGLIIKNYQESLDSTLLENLKNKYPVQINEKVKEEAFVSLNQ